MAWTRPPGARPTARQRSRPRARLRESLGPRRRPRNLHQNLVRGSTSRARCPTPWGWWRAKGRERRSSPGGKLAWRGSPRRGRAELRATTVRRPRPQSGRWMSDVTAEPQRNDVTAEPQWIDVTLNPTQTPPPPDGDVTAEEEFGEEPPPSTPTQTPPTPDADVTAEEEFGEEPPPSTPTQTPPTPDADVTAGEGWGGSPPPSTPPPPSHQPFRAGDDIASGSSPHLPPPNDVTAST